MEWMNNSMGEIEPKNITNQEQKEKIAKQIAKKVKDGDKKYCLFPEELLMIKKYLQFYLK